MIAIWLVMAAGVAIGVFVGPLRCPDPADTGDKIAFALAAPAVVPAAVGAIIVHGRACKESKP